MAKKVNNPTHAYSLKVVYNWKQAIGKTNKNQILKKNLGNVKIVLFYAGFASKVGNILHKHLQKMFLT